MLQLHYYPGNASLTPHILLEEIGVPFELKLVDRNANAHKSPEYLKLNPNGLIPVLVDGGLVLYETAAICLYLCDRHAEKGLAPASGAERAHFYKWLAWFSSMLQATLTLYFYPERWFPEGNAAAARELKASAEAKVGTLLDQVDAQLAASGGPWFLGERYSALDPYAWMLGRWTRAFARPARSLPHYGPYIQRMLQRPAVKKALSTERIVSPFA